MQFVHWNTRLYESIEAAVGRPNGIVIVSLFTQVSLLAELLNCVIWQNCWIASSYRNQLITSSAESSNYVILAELPTRDISRSEVDAWRRLLSSMEFSSLSGLQNSFSTTAFHKNTLKWPSLSSQQRKIACSMSTGRLSISWSGLLCLQLGREHHGLKLITDNLEDVQYKVRQVSIILWPPIDKLTLFLFVCFVYN